MPDSNPTDWLPVCGLTDLQDGRFFEFQAEDTAAFVFLHEGTPRAYQNRCPHRGITLNWAPGRFMDLDNRFLQCATHGALFRPENGHCIAGPCQGDQLTPVEVRAEGQTVLMRRSAR